MADESAFARACEAVDALLEGHADFQTDVRPEHFVRVVLKAVREPDEAMYDALCATGKMWSEQTSETAWKCYIDALLASPDPSDHELEKPDE